MYSSLRVVTPPVCLPVDLPLAAQHCRIDMATEFNLVELYVSTATMLAEQYLGRILIAQTLDWTVAESSPPASAMVPMASPATLLSAGTLLAAPLGFPWPPRRPLEIPRSPLISVQSVTLGGIETEERVLDASEYSVDLHTEPGRLLQRTKSPTAFQRMVVRFTAGYGTDPISVPSPIRNAILLMAAWLYEHRGDAEGDMPKAAQMLLAPYRLVTFGG